MLLSDNRCTIAGQVRVSYIITRSRCSTLRVRMTNIFYSLENVKNRKIQNEIAFNRIGLF